MSAPVWRIGQLLNAVQSSFVGLLRVWSIPIVLMLSVASGYTTYYGMSFFITWWIALIITIAVQSIVVICTLELASSHWRANLPRFLSIALTLVVAVTVSVSFSYFKFYEFSQRDSVQLDQLRALENSVDDYVDSVVRLKSVLVAEQQQRAENAGKEAAQAYIGAHPAMQGEFRNKVGKGLFWSHYNELQQAEQAKLAALQQELTGFDERIQELRNASKDFALHINDAAAHQTVITRLQAVATLADGLASRHGTAAVKIPRLLPFAEFSRGITPTFDMWKNISWFPLACAAMVDFFTLVLSYRLESTAPGPLTDDEKHLAYIGLRQFSEFTINHNDELEFRIEKTELERARRVPDWTRMFAVAFLLNRGYLRKIGKKSVEFAPNLYPIIAEHLNLKREAADVHPILANAEKLHAQMERKLHG